MENIVIFEKCGRFRIQFFYQHRNKHVLDILADLVLHGGVHTFLPVLVACFPVCHMSEFFSYEFIVLRRNDYGMYPDRHSGIPVVFNGKLRLGVGSEVRHQIRGLFAYPRKYLQCLV